MTKSKIDNMLKYKHEPSDAFKFRKKWTKKGYELVDITHLCKAKIGCSGWCNDFNEPDENIYHISIWYRDEVVANVKANNMYVIDDDKYVIYSEEDYTGDNFIVFRKVKL